MIIYAVNVHTGGGKVLLDEILRTHEFGRCTVLFVDERYRVPDDATVRDTRIVRVPPRLLRRWQAEWELRRVSRAMPSEEVLCFGNLPPVFRLPSRTILFLQNAFLLPGIAAPRDSLKTFLRCSYEKTWFRAFVSNADEIQVQTNWMRERLPPRLRAKAAIRVIMPTLPAPRAGVAKRYLFLAVSGHERHKNLNVLLQALRQVDLGGNRVAIVTGSPGAGAPPGLENSIDFHHGLSRDAVLALYEESRCLVMTSEIESFCLPLYEARHFGLDVIATRSGFVTEALAPGVVIGDVTPEGVAAALRQYMDAHTARSQESRTGAGTGPGPARLVASQGGTP